VATRRRRTRRQRLPPDQARRALLEAGRDHVYEHPIGEPLDHVRVGDIAERLDLTIGAVYHYWDSQDDYRDDLIDLLLAPESFPAATQAGAEMAAVVDDGTAFEDVVHLVATTAFRDLADHPERERLTLVLQCYGDEEIDARLAEWSREATARWSALIGEHLPRHGLEPRPPFDLEAIAVTLMGLAQGLDLRRGIDPGPVDARRPGDGTGAPDWDLFTAATLAFLTAACRPVSARHDPAGGARTLWDLTRRVVPRRRAT